MVFSPLLLIYIVSLFLLPEDKKKNIVVGHITYTRNYCEGAKPEEELLEELSTPKSYAGKMLFIRKGPGNNLKEPIIACVETDSSGNFEVHLEEGVYSVVSENKKEKTIFQQLLKEYSKETRNYSEVNIDCLNQWFSTPDFSFEVKDTTVTVSHNYFFTCPWDTIPCVQYTGPLPP